MAMLNLQNTSDFTEDIKKYTYQFYSNGEALQQLKFPRKQAFLNLFSVANAKNSLEKCQITYSALFLC